MTNLSDQLSTPRRPIVVYDGQCAFCIRQVTKMKQRDRNDTFDYLPNQTEGLELEFPKLMEQDLNAGMRLVKQDHLDFIGVPTRSVGATQRREATVDDDFGIVDLPCSSAYQ